MITLLLESLAVVLLYMSLLFIVALARRDNSLVDIGWGPGFIILVLFHLLRAPAITLHGVIVLCLVVVWGTRLGAHIYLRKRGRGEDFRYARWRKEWGKGFYVRSFLQIFVLQGILMTLVGFPLAFIIHQPPRPPHWLDGAGILIWVAGLITEWVADRQLDDFIRNRKERPGQVMAEGLWKYSRHPNYFGEALLWWGLAAISLPYSGGWVTLASPLLMDFLLLKVSGVPLLERKYRDNPEYQAYAERTSMLIPWFPRGSGDRLS